ncbi:NAD(P)-dependent alcohol dehydrogenase [Spirulina major CS-329]|uniref:NAD(P)-dependent alcohol dehydrogenase n=1 Tax=Spirulina TaxID=1154 RepID=UPI00232F9868|nr:MULTISPECIES: NAD(P)-dependent alcohol dehydrogenase [Spirulina]MDB9495921.1 NAD(P)-dependent alcohol dehydrogenase [Spirulina subsalsa CS-330]MDB9505448.1 NAD(P)-dependent alcohol dehydrogenase [Spirulina major CS-329]
MAPSFTPSQSRTEQPVTMRAIAQTRYGGPDVLSLQTVPKPRPADHDVLVRVYATSVHAGDWHLMRGTPWLVRLIYGGLFAPKLQILGSNMAGRVEAVGAAVTEFQPGDAVYGDLSEAGFGGFADYVCVPAASLALKPVNLSFEAAATVPVSALAALQGLQAVGQVQPGQRVLINGAAGGVGSFALQIAASLGAAVAGVCSASKVEQVRSHGYDRIFASREAAIADGPYDLILDTAAYRSVFDWLPALTPSGTYVLVGGSTARFFQVMLLGSAIAKLTGHPIKGLVSAPNREDLQRLTDLIEAGQVVPWVDRTYPLAETPAAIRALESRQICGKVAIAVYCDRADG